MSTTATPGRPLEYDSDAVLQAAMELFWSKGFEATSTSDIMKATGLSKSSLYNSFGSKRNLFDLALTGYQEFMFSMVEGRLINGEEGLDDLQWFVDFQREVSATDMGRNGCMCLNAAAELGAEDASIVTEALNLRTRQRIMITAALTRAAEAGEIDGSMIPHYANMILASFMGGAMISRAGGTREEMDSYLDSAQALIETFRI